MQPQHGEGFVANTGHANLLRVHLHGFRQPEMCFTSPSLPLGRSPSKSKGLAETKPCWFPAWDPEHSLLTGLPFPRAPGCLSTRNLSCCLLFLLSSRQALSFPSSSPLCSQNSAIQSSWLAAVCSLIGNIPQIHFMQGGSPALSHCRHGSSPPLWRRGQKAVPTRKRSGLLLEAGGLFLQLRRITVLHYTNPLVFDYTPGSVASVTKMVNELGWNKQVY